MRPPERAGWLCAFQHFNPRTREGCDQFFGFCNGPLHRHFNPRTREGCDNAANGQAQGTEVISIHAPVKGATADFEVGVERVITISIHAPVKGATSQRSTVMAFQKDFNPRTREGCDFGNINNRPVSCLISIHAPVDKVKYISQIQFHKK